MAKTAKKKAKPAKKSARVTAKPKAAAKTAKVAKKRKAPKKIDPLNRKQYPAVAPNINVADIRRAMNFYTSVFGFKVKQVMDTPFGIMHAEMTLRGMTVMLSPEHPDQGALSANAIGNTPITLYVLVENVDEVVASAVAAGGSILMPVSDMFWGDRTGVIRDPEGNKWMIATHKSEPTEAQMAEAMRQMQQQAASASA